MNLILIALIFYFVLGPKTGLKVLKEFGKIVRQLKATLSGTLPTRKSPPNTLARQKR